METIPRHKLSGKFIVSGLFSGLRRFADLEKRIAALPTAKERGDAFEVFAEAYLATQKLHEVSEIWPDDTVPLDISECLGLPSKDMGVDGVFQTLEGKLAAYQVKFRTDRPSLSWREISTFFGLADKADLKVLITNCDEIANVTADRANFYCIRGSDLDRLTKDDFLVIENWLQGSFIEQQVKTPRPHQTEALEALLTGFKSHDRVTSVMAWHW
jgi:predicted helicase